MELYPLSDFLFMKSDFKEEFGVYEGQYQVYWFEEVTQFETYKFYAIETLPEDLAAVGFKIGRNEFYIGTLYGEWCLFSNRNLDGRFPFKHASESTNSELFNWLKKPHEYMPSTKMPDLRLSDSDARDITAYLYGFLSIMAIYGFKEWQKQKTLDHSNNA